MITYTAVETVRAHLICDCGTEMNWDGIVYTTNPPRFPHTCPACGAKETHPVSYPSIEHR